MDLNTSQTIGSFVANDYRTATVFQKYGIDFCCKGGRTIEEVSQKKNISPDALLNELNDAVKQSNGSSIDFRTWEPDLLADYIERKHHRYVRQTIPALLQFLDKLCEVHGGNHPELFEIRAEFSASAEQLSLHMEKEEQVLFPFVRKMVASKLNESTEAASNIGEIQNPIEIMMQEHETEGDRFRKIAELSNNYATPADGCTTYRVAYALLKEFETDLHFHIHLENNILFPTALKMEKEFKSN
ncbi:MAG: iron-sulfur cluster repair di-iron protein [Ignavibacteriae bacterium HGW-Ignavibacteriae-1]|jgi:regulator of cell morphogenesis and NO signaling|nr:MAG: iron-sulfur cluster repair di-iron protein [Ignavibacteriae bacterium HGW-Ignavibacteriae-1]